LKFCYIIVIIVSVKGEATLVRFQEHIQQFIPQVETNLHVEGLVASLAISFSDDVQHNVNVNLTLMN
jgi:hypothetical protein